jgi:Auxiliary Activity family 9 (formerly GH61)
MRKDSTLLKVTYWSIFQEKDLLINTDKWANQIASDNSDSYKIQIPSDIKSGTYILRTELIAMHGNMAELKNNGLRGQIQIYPHCFNLDIISSGSAMPDGVNFPGAYKPNDTSFLFQPFMTYGNDTTGGTKHNSKFVSFLQHNFCL